MASSSLTGACTTTFTHSAEPLVLPTKSGPERALSELCQDTTPPCNLNPFLFNGHLQTFWTAKKYDGPSVHYKRRYFESDYKPVPGHFAIDYVVAPPPPADKPADDGGVEDEGLREDPTGVGHNHLPPRTTYFTDAEFESLASEDTKPLLISLHGLSGGSHEIYLRHVLEPLVQGTKSGALAGHSGGEWEALVVNSRGCAGTKATTNFLYNARATWDVRQVVKWCRKTWPKRPLFGVGYSLGANILVNYLGEEGSECQLKAATVVSNPWNLHVSSIALARTYLGREVYLKTMGNNMHALFRLHGDQILKNKAIDAAEIAKIKYLYEFDRAVQCPTWGYPTETAYYRDASSADALLAVRVPLFALNASDDPIAPDEALPYQEFKQNPWCVLCTTSGGGHLAWFEWSGQRWHAKPVVGFLNAMARDIDFEKLEASSNLRQGPSQNDQAYALFDPIRAKVLPRESRQ